MNHCYKPNGYIDFGGVQLCFVSFSDVSSLICSVVAILLGLQFGHFQQWIIHWMLICLFAEAIGPRFNHGIEPLDG